MCPDKAKPGVSEKLALAQEKYFSKLPEKMAEIDALWKKFNLASSDQLSVLTELHRQAHNLTGSAGTFGAEQLSNAAKELEQYTRAAMENKDNISQEESELIEQLIWLVKKQSQMK